MALFSINKSQFAVLGTLTAVIFLGACYFFIYVPNNEKTLQEHRFGILQNVDKNIQSKVGNSSALLNNLLDKYSIRDSTTIINEYIRNHSKDNFTLSDVDTISRVSQIDSGLLSSPQKINIPVIKRIGESSKFLRINIQFDLGQFFKPLLPNNTFDEYIIINKEAVVFETFPSGLKIIEQDTLLNAKSGFAGSGIKNAKIGGVDYKLFIQPVKIGYNNDWVIAGLFSNKNYQQEKNQLPTRVVLFLLVFAFGILVTFPWIKLYHMGSKDRLTVTDAIFSILVSMLLMSLLFFAFLKYNAPLRPELNKDHNEILAKNIAGAFEDEVELTRQKLQQIDAFINDGKVDANSKIINWKNRIIIGKDTVTEKINISQVFWLDSTGEEIINWNKDGSNNPKGNYRSRRYFESIQLGKTYLLNNEKGTPYFLEQVVSWSNGEFKSILSIPSKSRPRKSTVLAMSFYMKSLKNAILPPGYQFAFINKDGEVLYHSDTTKNLNENLIREFTKSKDLTSSLQASAAHNFRTDYYGKEYNAYIRPLNGLPYFIVVLGDTGIKDTRDMEIFGFSLSMLFCFFAFLVIQLFCVFLVSSKPSYFKQNLFDLGWIGPKKSFHRQYALCAFANFMLIIILALFYNYTTFFEFLFILLSSATLSTLYLNLLLQNYYLGINEKINVKHKIYVTICILVFLTIINIAAACVLDSFWKRFALFEVLALLTGGVIFWFMQPILKFIKSLTVPLGINDFAKSFTIMAVSRLVITSGLPIMLFYIASHNYEQNLTTRYRQVQFANKLIDKRSDLTGKTIDSINTGKYQMAVYKDNLWVNKIRLVDRPNKSHSKEDTVTMELFRLLRHYKSGNAVNSELFNYPYTANQSVYFNHITNETNSGTETYSRLPGRSGYLKISSANLNYRFPLAGSSFLAGLLYWFLFLAALIVLYLIILSVVKKLFALNLPDTFVWDKIDKALFTNPDLNKSLFLIGSPGAGKLQNLFNKMETSEFKYDENTPFVYNVDQPDKNNVYIADLTQIPDCADDKEQDKEWQKVMDDVLNEDWNLIIINHFEYNIKDPATNRIKLNLLESLRQKRKTKVVILSTIHPVTFLDSFNEQLINTQGNVVKTHDLERWHVLLGKYHIIFQPIDDASMKERILAEPEPVWERTVKKETNYADFLIAMQDVTIKASQSFSDKSDKQQHQLADTLALIIQRTSHYFYMYIWQSLTKEEKFLMYDLAEDGLVNSYDDHNLCILLEKGLIIRHDGTLKLFNKGFRNFILSSIGNSEAMKIKNEIKDNGNWSQLKTPLIVVIVAILVFLFASQQEAYSRLIAYATALGAGIPTVIRLFSLFDKTTQKTT